MPTTGRWRRWTPAAAERADWLFDALDAFRPPNPEREADQTLRDWLVGEALDKFREISTWLLIDKPQLIAYHTLSPARVSLPSGQSVEASNIRFL
ncbi:MAG TPA: hypothetical protein VJZ25_09020, partial [Gemmatimonadaceae bacterium]|nr:hypothetical protein [Gemmatimonadaceae bacterium]